MENSSILPGLDEACTNVSNTSIDTCNATSQTPEDYGMAVLTKVVRIAVPVLFSIVIIVGLAGNLLVVIVVSANQQMRNTTNLLIINLAMADLLFIVLCVPFTAVDYALPMQWPFGNIWCSIVQYMLHVTAYASVYTLV